MLDRAASATGDIATATQQIDSIGAAKTGIDGPVYREADANRGFGTTQRVTTRPASFGRRDRKADQTAAVYSIAFAR